MIVDSTIKAKYVAACDAAKKTIWTQKFVSEVGMVLSILSLVPLYCNNKEAIVYAKEPTPHQKCKHIKLRFTLFKRLSHVGMCSCRKYI